MINLHLSAYICTEVIILEENRNTITYDDNWQSVESEVPVIIDPKRNEEEEAPEPRCFEPPKQLLLTAQLVICILIAIAAFVLKSIGGEVYRDARNWYISNLNNTAIFDGREHFDLGILTEKATADEV